jgi:hypothetical protein
MIGNPTPQRLRVLAPRTPMMGFPELLESGALTTTERHLYHALALQRMEAGGRDLGFAVLVPAGVRSKKPAAA